MAETKVAMCLWKCRAVVSKAGDICPDCLDQEVRQLNARLKRLLPVEDQPVSRELRLTIQAVITRRMVVIRQMTKLRKRYWKVVNEQIKLPAIFLSHRKRYASSRSG